MKNDFASLIDLFVLKREIFFYWYGIGYLCVDCESGGGKCGFSEATNQSFCYERDRMIPNPNLCFIFMRLRE